MLNISDISDSSLKPEIVKTIATKDKGIDELAEKLLKHYKLNLHSSNMSNKYEKRYIDRINSLILKKTKNKFWTKENISLIDKEIKKNYKDRQTPSQVVDKFLK